MQTFESLCYKPPRATASEVTSATQPSILAENAMTLTPFEAGLMLHLIADWLLQNEWMAVNKVHLSHPAAWVHGSIHGVLLGVYFGWIGGSALALVHILIDTRVPIRWWIRVFKKCENSPDLPILLIGCDQVLHISCIAAWVLLARWL